MATHSQHMKNPRLSGTEISADDFCLPVIGIVCRFAHTICSPTNHRLIKFRPHNLHTGHLLSIHPAPTSAGFA